MRDLTKRRAVKNGGQVPLSEDEQRILNEIEQKLKESDPHLAREVSSYTVYRHAFRNLKWALVGFVGGLVLMIATLSTSFLLNSAMSNTAR